METVTLDQIFADMQAAAKAKRWLSCTYRINTDKGILPLGIKAFGKWVQIVQCCGISDSIPEQKTWKAAKAELHATVNAIVRSL